MPNSPTIVPMTVSLPFWIAFLALVAMLMILDLGLWRRKEKEMTVRASLRLSAGYLLAAALFGLCVRAFIGRSKGNDFFTGYFIEESLSMDNLFVIALIFMHFNIPQRHQRRVLLWGVLGAVLLRGIMITSGIALVATFHPVLYAFGIFLLLTGIRMLFFDKKERKSLEENRLLRRIKKYIPVTAALHGDRFFTHSEGRWMATPLFLALVFIELADIVFAIDSVPAVLAITTDTFVVYTSNIFAILGLRALYFALSSLLPRFAYMKYALSLVLVFIGSKIFLQDYLPITSGTSLLITVMLLAGGVLLSLHRTRRYS